MGKLRWTAWMGIAGAGMLVGLLLPFALQVLGVFLVVDDTLQPADAVVVLSGDTNRKRLDTALAILRAGMAKWVVVLTAPVGIDDEASAVRKHTESLGVEAGAA